MHFVEVDFMLNFLFLPEKNHGQVMPLRIMTIYLCRTKMSISPLLKLFTSCYVSCQDKQLKSASKRTEREILSEHKKRERQAAKQGKRPFYLKKCNTLSLSESSFVYVHLQV